MASIDVNLDKYIEKLGAAIQDTLIEEFSRRIRLLKIFDYENEEWYLLVYYLGKQEMLNLITEENDVYYFFLAVKSDGNAQTRLRTPTEMHLIHLTESYIDRRILLTRQFKL